MRKVCGDLIHLLELPLCIFDDIYCFIGIPAIEETISVIFSVDNYFCETLQIKMLEQNYDDLNAWKN